MIDEVGQQAIDAQVREVNGAYADMVEKVRQAESEFWENLPPLKAPTVRIPVVDDFADQLDAGGAR